jgi:hypothetical protein
MARRKKNAPRAAAGGRRKSHTAAQHQSAIDSLTGDVPPQSVEMASGQCWMAQEKKKNVNDLDAKIAAVDKCIADGKRHLPPAG